MVAKTLLHRLLRRDPNMQPNLSYGQDGEDLILNRLLDGQENGFFVDVGAHHPVRFSNTYLLYLRGWRGINIDAMPGSMDLFNRVRPRDINIECGVASVAGQMRYYRFNEPALNTFDPGEADKKNAPPYRLVDTVDVGVERLDVLISKHLPKHQTIDVLTVDVEGKDLDVLRSNDWQEYRPRVILAETLRTDLLNFSECPVAQLLIAVGYRPVAKVYNTSFFMREDC